MSVAVDEPEQSAHLAPRHFLAPSTRDLVPERAVIDSMRYERVSLTGSKQQVIWGASAPGADARAARGEADRMGTHAHPGDGLATRTSCEINDPPDLAAPSYPSTPASGAGTQSSSSASASTGR
jgi:hypothetical protein